MKSAVSLGICLLAPIVSLALLLWCDARHITTPLMPVMAMICAFCCGAAAVFTADGIVNSLDGDD